MSGGRLGPSVIWSNDPRQNPPPWPRCLRPGRAPGSQAGGEVSGRAGAVPVDVLFLTGPSAGRAQAVLGRGSAARFGTGAVRGRQGLGLGEGERSEPPGRKRNSPSHPQEAATHSQSQREFPHSGWSQVSNAWSPPPPVASGEESPSPLPRSPFLPWLLGRCQIRSFSPKASGSFGPGPLTCWWMNRGALVCHWSKGSRSAPLRASLDGGGGTGGGTAISWYVWFPVG